MATSFHPKECIFWLIWAATTPGSDAMRLVRAFKKAGIIAESMPLDFKSVIEEQLEIFHQLNAIYNRKGGLESRR